MTWWLLYFLAWVATTLLSLLLTRWFQHWGAHTGFIDRPRQESHKQHSRAVPSLGGAAMFLSFMAVMGGGLLAAAILPSMVDDWKLLEHIPGVWKISGRLAVIAGGGLCMLLLGLIDDRHPLRPKTKLLGQALICGVVAAFAIRITVFIPHPLINWAVTVLWLLLIVNAINIFDNMDGMAGGCAVIASLLFFLIAGLQEQYFVAVLSAVLGGAALGFLILNWPPARIFMGDSGSHFLGYMLAVTGALVTYYSPQLGGTRVSVLVPLMILAIPIFDFGAVIFIRLRQGTPIYQADNQHLSHRFAMLGLDRRQIAYVVNLLSLAIGAGAIPLLWLPRQLAVVVLIQAGAMLALVSILHTVKNREHGLGSEMARGRGKNHE